MKRKLDENLPCILCIGNRDEIIFFVFAVPPTITSPPENVIAVETKEARMRCVAEGDPKPKITWLNEVKQKKNQIETSL